MRKLDIQETKILKQLVRNPRVSDNQISKNTRVPVMTVNRKRKLMEEEGIINYYTDINHGDPKTKVYDAIQLYTIQFKIGITREHYIKAIMEDRKFRSRNSKYHAESYLGEKEGHLALVIMLEANSQSELIEIFNGEIVQGIKSRYGEDCINKIDTTRIDVPIRMHHNYLPLINMEKGIIKKEWDDEWIYVSE
jgi:DNA-binding Lrp family transcriptional regulator